MRAVQDAVRALTARNFTHVRLPARGRTARAELFARDHGLHIDLLRVTGLADAHAARMVAGPSGPGNATLLWAAEGGFVEVVVELLSLPEPGEPGAPTSPSYRVVRPRYLWTRPPSGRTGATPLWSPN
ncbi:hypothetical protein C1701_08915 [Actinoalloteichus sp. AHMU CJ021]|uniref:Uncharacterized protein n=1 Tax=Actinoalloteichus caeruleus DSM 43889 TaxID=1120930 RepID=A0ABT1JJA5_ACTCY|nr:hypothetical protein [Actinoalloteichus caeruleus]AUS78470.1 hypothetical protein C1701_08915 [Actinoalloteichus sp. AHMU CJ021]MCP2332568.1 hypothetical protein [Actinoalloteichus caeruleus DSM 43889]